jgi:hypothetical protein
VAGDARDVEVDIVANDKTRRGVDSAARNFDGLDRDVKRASKDRTKQIKKDTDKSRSIFTSLFGALIDQGQKSGMLAAGATIDGFGSAFKALPAEVKVGVAGALLAGATLATPGIIATMDAAILAGVGGGGLAIGIALAMKDPAVAAAYNNLGQRITTRLQTSVAPFKSELIDSADIFEKSFTNVAPAIDRIFGRLAPMVSSLAAGLGKGIENVMPGLERAVQASLPLLRELAAELPHIGELVGELFGAIADGGPGAALAFKLILINVEALIKLFSFFVQEMGGVANGVAVLTNAGVALGQAMGLLDDKTTSVITKLGTGGAAASSSATGFRLLSLATYNTADAARAADAAFSSLFGELMSVDQANLAVKTGMAQLTTTIKGNAKTLDQNTEAGRANTGAILGQISALDQKRQADIAAGNGTVEATNRANAAYAANVAALRKVLIQLGLTAAEVDVLIGKYESIPRNIGTTITTTYKTVGTPTGNTELGRGLSRDKFGGLDGWSPLSFASARPGGRGGGDFAMVGTGAGRTTPPYQIDQHLDVSVLLDGEPVRRAATRAARREVKRQAWRDRVGPR